MGINPGGAYLDLWCRDFGQSLIEIRDEEDHAYAAGYRGQRGVRTWRDHMKKIESLHFIKIEAKGSRAFAYVLLLDPLAVARWYNDQNKTPPGWWRAFSDRAREIGATIPPALDPATTSTPTRPKPNTVEIGASHGLLLPWVFLGPKLHGGHDSHATGTMHAAAR